MAVLLAAAAPGGVDAGEAVFLPSGLCALAHIEQSFLIPTFAQAQPLVLDLIYKDESKFGNVPLPVEATTGVSWGANWWVPLPAFSDTRYHGTRICLGEAAFAPPGTAGRGAPVTLALGPFERALDCPRTAVVNFAIDHARVEAAQVGECGTVFGEGVNPDAEGSGDGRSRPRGTPRRVSWTGSARADRAGRASSSRVARVPGSRMISTSSRIILHSSCSSRPRGTRARPARAPRWPDDEPDPVRRYLPRGQLLVRGGPCDDHRRRQRARGVGFGVSRLDSSTSETPASSSAPDW